MRLESSCKYVPASFTLHAYLMFRHPYTKGCRLDLDFRFRHAALLIDG